MALTVLGFSSPFLADGFGDGTLTLLDVSGLVTNSICRISADGQPTKVGKIQKVTGQVVTVISVVTSLPLDLTSYLVSRNAKLTVTGQTVTAGKQVADPRPVLATGTGADKMGVATLAGGTITIATTAVKTASVIVFARKTAGGTLGNLSRGAVVAGTSFIIQSDSGTETSTVDWAIIS